MLLSIAITGGLILFFGFFLYYIDNEKEPSRYVFWALITGFIAAVIERVFVRYFILKLLPIRDLDLFTALLNDEYVHLSLGRAVGSAIIVGGIIQELVKVIAYEWVTHRYDYEIDQPYDCIVYAVMVGLGFQILSILIMAQTKVEPLNDSFYKSAGIVSNVLTAAALGRSYSVLHKFPPPNQQRYSKWIALGAGFLFAALIHASLRLLFVVKETPTSIAGIVVLTVLCIYLGRKAYGLHRVSKKDYKV